MSTSPYAVTIVKPLTITSSMLVSSNVPETDYAAWSSGSTYAVGNRVILTSTHKVYESLQSSNINHDPLSSPTWWIEVSPTNRWKAFDTSNSTQTVYPGNSPPNIAYVINPSQAIGVVALLNLQGATEVTIVMTDPVYGSVYNETFNLSALPIFSSWWHWLFSAKASRSSLVVSDLPSFPNASISISITGNTDLAVGVVMMGQPNQFSLGIKYGAQIGIQDYSRKETNDFGDTVLTQRAFAKRASFDLFIENAEVDQLQNFLTSIRAEPVLWIGTNSFEATTVFGFYKNFDILLSYTDHAECSLEIEGLT